MLSYMLEQAPRSIRRFPWLERSSLIPSLAGSQPQKGVVTYSLSANRQRPLAGTFNAAIFNTFRRTRHQILYWLPAMLIGYTAMQWAMEKYVAANLLGRNSDTLQERVLQLEAGKTSGSGACLRVKSIFASDDSNHFLVLSQAP